MKEERRRVFCNFVRELATLSKCRDKGVAAVITDSDLSQVYSIGINGGPKGGLDCLCTLGGKYTCVHAEANAIAKCTATDNKKIMFCTLSPCVTCASLIINNGFSAVVILDRYKDPTGIKMLQDAGIKVFYDDAADLSIVNQAGFTGPQAGKCYTLTHRYVGNTCEQVIAVLEKVSQRKDGQVVLAFNNGQTVFWPIKRNKQYGIIEIKEV